jgi:hypothetical protein
MVIALILVEAGVIVRMIDKELSISQSLFFLQKEGNA